MVGERMARVRATTARIAWCVLMVVGLAAPAVAQPQPEEARREALKLAGEAMDLYTAGDFAAALDKFGRADKLTPAPTLKLRVARCLDKLDRMNEAAAAYRAAIATELAPSAPAQHHEARKAAIAELADLLKQIPSVTVIVEGTGADRAAVRLDDKPLARSQVGQKHALDPGPHRFEAVVGKRRARAQALLARGKDERVVLTLPAPEVPDKPPPQVTAEDEGRPFRIAGWSLVGLGGACLSLGSIAGVIVLEREADLVERCPNRQCAPDAHEDAKSFDTWRALSTAGLVIGGVMAATGITLVLVAPGAPETEGEVSLTLVPGGGGVEVAF
jgi:hypothetical protein